MGKPGWHNLNVIDIVPRMITAYSRKNIFKSFSGAFVDQVSRLPPFGIYGAQPAGAAIMPSTLHRHTIPITIAHPAVQSNEVYPPI